MKFIDLHVHSLHSSGVDTPSRLYHHAKELDIQIGICDGIRHEGFSGTEIHARTKKDLITKLKNDDLDYCIVHGGDYKINRLAASDGRVDVIAHPEISRNGSGIDAVVAKMAAENGVAIEINLKNIIASWGPHRVNLIKHVKNNLMLKRKYGFDLILTTGAKSRYDLRAGDGVCEFLKVIGLTDDEIRESMAGVPAKLIKNRGETK
jgi:ribonuclease P/MRP protein subunit RPP1